MKLLECQSWGAVGSIPGPSRIGPGWTVGEVPALDGHEEGGCVSEVSVQI